MRSGSGLPAAVLKTPVLKAPVLKAPVLKAHKGYLNEVASSQ